MGRAKNMLAVIAAMAGIYEETQRLRALDDGVAQALGQRADSLRALAWLEHDKGVALFNLLLVMPHGEYLRLLAVLGEG